MYQGTTPALVFEVPKYDLTDKTVYLTFFMRPGCQMTKTGDDLTVLYDKERDMTSILCRLTQEETLAMKSGEYLFCQARFIDGAGLAYTTTKAPISIEDAFLKQVIKYIGGSGA